MNDIVKNKKRKFALSLFKITSIVIILIIVLCLVFGIIDYFRTKIGKKPLFIYHTENIPAMDIGTAGFNDILLSNKESSTYYGIGYTISICDLDTKKYTFELGYKKVKPCNTDLTCSSNKYGSLVLNDDSTIAYDENDKDNYYYSFFEGKLDKVIVTLIRPISSIENLDTASADIKKFYENIPGCAGGGKKLNDKAYETLIACTISKMSSDDIDNYLPIRTKELIGYTRDEIIAYHHNDLTCE